MKASLRFPLSLIYLIPTLVLIGCGNQSSTQPDAQITTEGPTSLMRMEMTNEASTSLMDTDMPMRGIAANHPPDTGQGPGMAGNRYDVIHENQFSQVIDSPLSTFSIDVDTASYRGVRQYLLEYNQLPRPDAVRIEELLNYFLYPYDGPDPNQNLPFAVDVDTTLCPWNDNNQLVRVALKGKQVDFEERPKMNLVLLIDTSGSMNQPNKLPLLKQGMRLLLNQCDHSDRIAIVAYAGTPGLVLDSTPADDRDKIMDALNRLEAGGSTNGGGGIQLAYKIASENFIENGTNRILLGTDGDFNVGMTGTDQMVHLVEQKAKQGIDLTVLGFGMGNYNDAMLEQISGKGNGNYALIDTFSEAKKVLLEQLSGTLITIAKDVKIQIEFNPNKVSSYRLIGYENRVMADKDFNNDMKDAGEIGAGHSVTALYEVVPVAASGENETDLDPLKYQTTRKLSHAADTSELMTVKLRYKNPKEQESKKIELVVQDEAIPFNQTDPDFRFAAAVANFGMQLRNSEHKGVWSYSDIQTTARACVGEDRHGFREEFLQMVSVAKSLSSNASSLDISPPLLIQ